ncbi:MAG TPA: type IV toxin-antitoxin system AbiEi family antitoxin domain-containing protein [bacterium]|nr:type IV toxin-antitoxin system AbiEi family antitoxin domain-containing protein [bacterium]
MRKRIRKSPPILEKVFKKQGGILRTMEILSAGIHPRTLYDMKKAGTVETLHRGVYRLASLPAMEMPDLVVVALRVPKGVVCLTSALSFHRIGTQIPHQIHVALRQGSERPRIRHIPVKVHWFGGAAFTEGVETHKVDDVALRVYSVAKTVADCFKYRKKIGLDVALEALREGWKARKCTMDELWKYAKLCRVANVMRPYLESLT